MNKIKDLRKENRISQSELARKFNITQQAISLYEKGAREPDSTTLNNLADFFNVSIDYILGRSSMRNLKCESFLDLTGLPEEAINKVVEYVELIKLKYKENRG